MTRTIPKLALAACACLLLMGGAAPPASAKSCTPPRYPGDGYFTSLIVRGTTCARGREVALAHYRCRVRAGGRAGRCRTRVLRYRCREVRNSIPTEIDARVTCLRGDARVVHTYQQNR